MRLPRELPYVVTAWQTESLLTRGVALFLPFLRSPLDFWCPLPPFPHPSPPPFPPPPADGGLTTAIPAAVWHSPLLYLQGVQSHRSYQVNWTVNCWGEYSIHLNQSPLLSVKTDWQLLRRFAFAAAIGSSGRCGSGIGRSLLQSKVGMEALHHLIVRYTLFRSREF